MRGMDSDLTKIDSTYLKLKDLVTHYDLVTDSTLRILPGEHLHIDELSERVKASATPVRQALERLHGEGLIDSIPKRGFFSKIPDALELQQLYEFALLVLSYSIRKSPDPSAIVGAGRGPIEVEAAADGGTNANCTKHQAIVIENVFERIVWLSRNRQMNRMIRNFNDRSRYVRCLCLAQSPDPLARVRESLMLVDLIRQQDIEAAGCSLETQMTRKISRLPQLVRDAQSRWRRERLEAI